MGFGDLGELVCFLQGKKLLSSLKAELGACSAGVCQDTAVLSHGGDDAHRGHHRSSASAGRDCGGARRGAGCSKALQGPAQSGTTGDTAGTRCRAHTYQGV